MTRVIARLPLNAKEFETARYRLSPLAKKVKAFLAELDLQDILGDPFSTGTLVRCLSRIGYPANQTRTGISVHPQTRAVIPSDQYLELRIQDIFPYRECVRLCGYGVSIKEAKLVYKKVLSCREKQKKARFHISERNWLVNINRNGDLRVGCMTIGWPEVEHFAKTMGWGRD